jgi:O-antigen/teichoic acid export membrane protein
VSTETISEQQPSIDVLSTEHLKADLKGRSVRGGVLTLTSQGTQFVIQSVATVVLARLLTPADFGLVAMVSTITGLASGFADLGLSEATIQRREINHNQVSFLFWINVAIGLGLMLITAASAPLLAHFYRDQRLVNITLVLSITFLIGGLRVQPDALLKRQMRFSLLAARDITASILGVCVGIVLAMRGAGYWALVALPLTLNVTVMILSWFMVRWKPSLPRRDSEVGSMVAFGGNVAASYMIINLNRSADNVLIGWYWGAAPLGLYSRAYNLLMLPVRQLSAPAGSVAVPAFSNIQSEPERFARYYLRAVNLMMWIGAAIFAFLFVTAGPVIVLILGKKWHDAAPVFQILAISALGQLLLESILWLFVSRGQSARLLKLLFVISPIIIISFVVGLPFGIKGVALSGSIVLIAIFPWVLKYTFRGTTLTLEQMGRALVYPLAVGLTSVLVAELVLYALNPQSLIFQLSLAAACFLGTYLFAMVIRPIRDEIMSLRNLASDLRLSRQAA